MNENDKQAEPLALPKFNCWSTSEGDSWFDHPADAQAIYERLGGFAKVGDEYELLAGWRSVTARYRIVSIDGDDFEVECVSHTHPAKPVQPAEKPPLVRLTDEEIERIFDSLPQFRSWAFTGPQKDFAYAIMDAMEEKNK